MNVEPGIIVWCDSPLGLISTRVDEQGKPVVYDISAVDDTVALPTTVDEVFAILNRRDGQKVAVRKDAVELLFGWTY